MIKKEKCFNDFFKITDDSYVNIPMYTDILVYIDPSLIKAISHPYFDSQKAEEKVINYFSTAFNAYKQGNEKLAIQLINYPKEVNELHFGHSVGSTKGTGPSEEILHEFFKRITKESSNFSEHLAENPILFPLFVKNFGSDRFSDLIACIIKKELAEFTEKISTNYNLPVSSVNIGKYYNVDSNKWEEVVASLPLDTKQQPILLCPKGIVVEEYNFSTTQYINLVIIEQLQDYHYRKQTPGLQHTKTENGVIVPTKPTKKMVRKVELEQKYSFYGKEKAFAFKYTMENPSALGEYLERKKRE